ncbi:MAG: hypothetical protein AAFQ34_15395 [Pseudomonadota bacterium]
MKSIFRYGSKFRLIPNFNKARIKDEIRNDVNEFIYKLSCKINVCLGYFSEWTTKLLNLIFGKIESVENIFPPTTNFGQFCNKVKILQSKYVIMPVDKANNNFGFVCKKFYSHVLFSEIDSGNVFDQYNNNATNIKDAYDRILKEYKISPTSYNIPFMYAIPKFHKNPVKFRFITSSFNCISKKVCIFLNLILDKLVSTISMESEFNWIIKNNNKVLEMLNGQDDNHEIPHDLMVATFDFSTLYTTLPHDDLVRCIVALFNKYFTSDVIINYENKKIVVTKSKFVEILKFCIQNSFIYFDNKIYKQVMGIPMGANFSPNAANLYLHFYESKFMNINCNENRLVYSYVYRFIDDLLAINNGSILRDINSIYPPALEIQNTNVAPHGKCSFLDIDIEITDNRFVHKVYDKRRDYNFEILGLPSFNSNTPSKLAYGVLCSQFCRYASICKYREDFIFNCQLFIRKLQQNNFPMYVLKKLVNKFQFNKRLTLSKFNLDFRLIDLLQF